ncbi:MAG TPA: TlpA disulfide reductase family protein [Spongiibacteraceae bacterium]|nr:TlpA disulfide reductase family protein [Spongiibacteraceae bacterium]
MSILPRTAKILIIVTCMGLLSACSKPDYHTADGGSGRFADARGKWLLINYWAEWCKPCLKEMPELRRFQQQYADKALLLTVNYDGAQGQALQQQIAKIGIKLPVLLEDPAARLGTSRPDVLPTTLIFDPQGKLHETLQGEQTLDTLAAAIGAQPVKNSQ